MPLCCVQQSPSGPPQPNAFRTIQKRMSQVEEDDCSQQEKFEVGLVSNSLLRTSFARLPGRAVPKTGEGQVQVGQRRRELLPPSHPQPEIYPSIFSSFLAPCGP
jgi:hypothetical protein